MPSDHDSPEAGRAIRELLDGRLRAIAAKDVDAVAAQYAPDVVMYNLAPPLQTRGVNRSNIEAWFGSYDGPIGCELRDVTVASSGDLGFCHYLYRITGTQTTGEAVDMWVRATLGLRRTDGRWLIAHEHDSDPFDMKTFKALLDLQP